MITRLDIILNIIQHIPHLPRIVHPYEDEPAESILIRLAASNGFSSIHEMIVSSSDIKSRDVVAILHNRQCRVALASKLTRFSQESVEMATPVRTQNNIILKGHYFTGSNKVSRARICIECLKTDQATFSNQLPHRRNWWEIPQLSSCPIHGVALEESCPKCERPFRIIDHPMHCPCNPHFEMTKHTSRKISAENFIHDKWLGGRIGILEPSPHYLLDKMEIHHASRLCQEIGSMYKKYHSEINSSHATHLNKDDRATGWKILEDWPTSFENFLLESSHTKVYIFHTSIERKISIINIVKSFLGRNYTKDYDPIREVVRNYVRKYIITTPKYKLFGSLLHIDGEITVPEAAQTLNCSKQVVRALVASLNIPISKNKEWKYAPSFSNNRLDEMRSFLDECVALDKIHESLGIKRKWITTLIKKGLLLQKINLLNITMLSKKDFERILNLLDVPILENRANLRGMRNLNRLNCVDTLECMLLGELRAVGRNPGTVGLRGLLFEPTQAILAIARYRGTISPASIAMANEWSMNIVKRLVRLGYLEIMECGNICIDQYDDFKKSYILPIEILRLSKGIISNEILSSFFKKLKIKAHLKQAKYMHTKPLPRDSTLSALEILNNKKWRILLSK